MEIKTQKDLEKLIRMLHKNGVESIKVDNIELHLGKMPLKASKSPVIMPYVAPEEDIKVPQFNGYTPNTEATDTIETDELSEEELLFYSATGEAQ